MSRKDSTASPGFGDNGDRDTLDPLTTAAAARLKTIAATLNLPVAAFKMSGSGAVLPRVFASQEDEAAEVLRLYFGVDDIATRLRYLELLRGLSALEAKVVGE